MADSWFREEWRRAKARNAAIPRWARMVVTSPTLSAHVRPTPTQPESVEVRREEGQADAHTDPSA